MWSIPLTLIQAWAKVENVAKIPGLDWIEDIHGGSYRALINGYLPVITLLGLILLLPIIFKAVAETYLTNERRVSRASFADHALFELFLGHVL